MNLAVGAFLLAAAATLAVAYDAKFDEFDAEGVAANPAALEAVVKCLAGLGVCNEQGAAYKELMPEVVMTTCGKCTPRQQEILKIVMGAAKRTYPDIYEAFKKAYDPNNAKGSALDAFVSRR
ncbi:Putative odorant-binding protein A10 [Eumeta japonica]|uniref:Odorant-binding protein A10 n=1 Tax=Eumeta variegata TaxID=151549 RepID=A0A4C1T2Y8_EUMVA|nr:Putative odorant-binding protein A10 [Eumeta japonica]